MAENSTPREAEAAPAGKPCCAGGPAAQGPSAAEAHEAFLGAAFAPGAIDAVTKELMTIGLAVLARCEPCVRYHVPQALKMGITRAEIEEIAWMAIAMGGAPVMMFWNEEVSRIPTE
jgi:AhpD family alkylhydroperoxidase